MKAFMIPYSDGRIVAVNPREIEMIDGTDREFTIEFRSGRRMTCKGMNVSLEAFIQGWGRALDGEDG